MATPRFKTMTVTNSSRLKRSILKVKSELPEWYEHPAPEGKQDFVITDAATLTIAVWRPHGVLNRTGDTEYKEASQYKLEIPAGSKGRMTKSGYYIANCIIGPPQEPIDTLVQLAVNKDNTVGVKKYSGQGNTRIIREGDKLTVETW